MINDNRIDKRLQELESVADWLINAAVSFKNELQAARAKLNLDPNKSKVKKRGKEISSAVAKHNAKIFRKK